jgi:hypothetical protein
MLRRTGFEQKILKLFPGALRTNPDVEKERVRDASLHILSQKTRV